MEILAAAAVLGVLVFWKKSPLQGILHPSGQGQLPPAAGTMNNTSPGQAPGAVAITAPGTGGGIGTKPPANPSSPDPTAGWGGFAIGAFGALANAVKGIAGSSSTSGFPYGSSTPGPTVYPDGTQGGPAPGYDNVSNDPNFPGYDPNGNYNPGTGQAATGNYDDGTIGGGGEYWNSNGQSAVEYTDPWGGEQAQYPLDPYNSNNSDPAGGDW